jgi:hypothetical protein
MTEYKKKPFEGCIRVGENKYTDEGFFDLSDEEKTIGAVKVSRQILSNILREILLEDAEVIEIEKSGDEYKIKFKTDNVLIRKVDEVAISWNIAPHREDGRYITQKYVYNLKGYGDSTLIESKEISKEWVKKIFENTKNADEI